MKRFWPKIAAPAAEALVTIGLGLVLLNNDQNDLANMVWIVGGLLLVNQVVTTIQLSSESAPLRTTVHTELQPVRKLAEAMDLSRECSVEDLRSLHALYLSITEPDFYAVKQSAVDEAQTKLRRLANDKRSETIATGAYYNWLLPMIDGAPKGSTMWAVSLMMDCEWDDSPYEKRFLEANLRAAQRGVNVTRIFIVPGGQIDHLAASMPVASQMDPDSGIEVLLVEHEWLDRREPGLLARAGDGIIAFDDRVVLVDEHSLDGTARGYVTANPVDIKAWRKVFEELRQHAEPMAEALRGRTGSPERAQPEGQ